MLTVKQLARLAGVTPRTLHYYHEIGLLKPTRTGENGYRYYGEDAVLALQQILLYRELEIPLERIRQIMAGSDFDILAALEHHRAELAHRAARLERLRATVDNTILHLKGVKEMSKKQFFEGFSDEQQEAYEKEALQLYDPETVKASAKRWKNYSAAEKQRIGEEGNAVYAGFVSAMTKGPASPEAQESVERWRKHMDYFWTPNLDQLVALSEGYVEDPRFKANFDKIHPELAEFVRDAVKVYVRNSQ